MGSNILVQNVKKYYSSSHRFINTGTGASSLPISNYVNLPKYTVLTIENCNVGIRTTSPVVALEVWASNAILLPKGTSSSRPTGVEGYIRYNTESQQFEGFGAGNQWGSLGGVKSVAGDTYILAEYSAGNDDKSLHFYTSNVEYMTLNSNGNLGIGTTNPGFKLHVNGDSYINDNLFVNNNIQASSLSGTAITDSISTSSSTIAASATAVKTAYDLANNALPKSGGIVNGDVFIFANLTASNLTVIGESVILNTITSNTEQMVIENAGTGPALKVTQTGPQPIADFYDDNSILRLRIADGGNIGIGSEMPAYKLDVNGNAYISGPLIVNNTVIANLIGTATQVSQDIIRGAYLTGNNYNGSVTTTWAVDADVNNTANKIVVRDASGNFSAGVITANLTGTATQVSQDIIRGTYLTGNNYNGSVTTTWGVDADVNNTANKVVVRDASGNFSAGMITANLIGTANQVSQDIIRGAYLTGNNYNGSVATTWTVDADVNNTANKIVVRDAFGNFSAGVITANLTGTATQVSQAIIRGTYLIGDNYNGSVATTWTVDADVNNTANKIVVRDASGNFSAGVITANLTGTANQVSQAIIRGTYLTGNNYNGSVTTTWGVDADVNNTANKVVVRDASGNFSAGMITANLTGTATQVSQAIIRGTYLTGNNYNGSVATTWTVDADVNNTANKIVVRDAFGNFSAGVITANLTGTATQVSQAIIRGTYLIGDNYNGSTSTTWAVDADVNNTANKIVVRDASGNIYAGNVGIGTNALDVALEVHSKTAILLPKGTFTERPTGVQGYIRYNTESQQFEGFGAGNQWGSLGGVGVINTAGDTYILADYTEGNDDKGLHFYTSNIEYMILNSNGYLGIGTSTPRTNLDVNGNIRTDYNITTSNLTILGSLSFEPIYPSTIRKTSLQINPIRKTIHINTPSSNEFYLQIPGSFGGYASNVQVFLNQSLLMYYTDTIKDYDVTVQNFSLPQYTVYTVSLTTPAIFGDVVDITVWPQIVQDSTPEAGYVYQQVQFTDTYFRPTENDIFYNFGNVAIGTSNTTLGKLVISGNIVPGECNVYDLGTSNLRWRDIYLSGNTIDLGGTMISRNESTGGMMVKTTTGLLVDNTVHTLHASNINIYGGNIGIGTTITEQKLDIRGGAVISGNVGIGTLYPEVDIHIASAIPSIKMSGGDLNGNIININDTSYLRLGSDKSYKTHISVVGDTYPYGGAGRIDINYKDYVTFKTINGISGTGTERIRIDVNGNIGIGTTIAQQKLDIRGGAVISGNIGIGTLYPEVDIHIASSIPTIKMSGGDLNGNIININDTSYLRLGSDKSYKTHISVVGDTYPYGGAGRIDINYKDYVTFKTINGISGTGTERIRIDVNGNVGIRTTNPQVPLHVIGNATITSATDTILTVETTNDANKAEVAIMGNNQGTGRVYVGQSSTYGGGIEYNGDNSPVTTGAGSDYITLYRRDNGVDYWTARNLYNTNNWEFRGDISGATISGTHSGTLKPGTDFWHTSTDNQARFWFANGGRTYFRSGSGFEFRSAADVNIGSLDNSGNLVVPGEIYTNTMMRLNYNNPTICFQDTDHNTGFIHVNSSIMYVLRGGNNTTSWSQVNGEWPWTFNLTNNDSRCGGALTVVGNITTNYLTTGGITSTGSIYTYMLAQTNSGTDLLGTTNAAANNTGYQKFIRIMYNTFTGMHRNFTDDELFNIEDPNLFKTTYVGRIVISIGDIATHTSTDTSIEDKEGMIQWEIKRDKEGITIEDALPIVRLSRQRKDKRVFGVLGMAERNNSHAERLIINSLGEGAMWVVNTNGSIENGDYIQSSPELGYGERQDDDLLHNYTVAKATIPCDFTLNSPKYECIELNNGVRAAFIAVTYHCG